LKKTKRLEKSYTTIGSLNIEGKKVLKSDFLNCLNGYFHIILLLRSEKGILFFIFRNCDLHTPAKLDMKILKKYIFDINFLLKKKLKFSKIFFMAKKFKPILPFYRPFLDIYYVNFFGQTFTIAFISLLLFIPLSHKFTTIYKFLKTYSFLIQILT